MYDVIYEAEIALCNINKQPLQLKRLKHCSKISNKIYKKGLSFQRSKNSIIGNFNDSDESRENK
jgi:hypothetical protein